MGECVFVMGRTGSGKSYSLRNLDPSTCGVFEVGGKRLPFRSGLPTYYLGTMGYRERYQFIEAKLLENSRRLYVIDDSSFLQADENLERVFQKGDKFQMYAEIGFHLARLVQCATRTDAQTVVYFLHHVDTDDYGRDKVRSIGKLVEEKYNPIERCNVVIDCVNDSGAHKFRTSNTGGNLAKSPVGMLPEEMDNDLAEVDRMLREFYGMEPLASDGKEKDHA